jgi:hypothetical protein
MHLGLLWHVLQVKECPRRKEGLQKVEGLRPTDARADAGKSDVIQSVRISVGSSGFLSDETPGANLTHSINYSLGFVGGFCRP